MQQIHMLIRFDGLGISPRLEKGDAAAIPVPSRREWVATQIRVHAPQSLLSATNIGKPEATHRRGIHVIGVESDRSVVVYAG